MIDPGPKRARSSSPAGAGRRIARIRSISGLAVTTEAASANPGSPRCITKAEWRKIKPNMTRAKVKRIAGINGKVTSRSEDADGNVDMQVEYRQCKRNGKPAFPWNVTWVEFDNYKDNPDYWNFDLNDNRMYLCTPMLVSSRNTWYSIY